MSRLLGDACGAVGADLGTMYGIFARPVMRTQSNPETALWKRVYRERNYLLDGCLRVPSPSVVRPLGWTSTGCEEGPAEGGRSATEAFRRWRFGGGDETTPDLSASLVVVDGGVGLS